MAEVLFAANARQEGVLNSNANYFVVRFQQATGRKEMFAGAGACYWLIAFGGGVYRCNFNAFCC
jgi:hypothetical protein